MPTSFLGYDFYSGINLTSGNKDTWFVLPWKVVLAVWRWHCSYGDRNPLSSSVLWDDRSVCREPPEAKHMLGACNPQHPNDLGLHFPHCVYKNFHCLLNPLWHLLSSNYLETTFLKVKKCNIISPNIVYLRMFTYLFCFIDGMINGG